MTETRSDRLQLRVTPQQREVIESAAESQHETITDYVVRHAVSAAKEDLANVVRHARAGAVAVELRNQDGHLHLFVRDDGAGFDGTALPAQAVLTLSGSCIG